MKVLIISHYFPPEVNAPANRTSEHAEVWTSLGANVTVITNNPHHPHGNLYPGYANKFIRDRLGHTDILRVKSYLAPNAGFAKRIVNYIIFMIRAIWVSRKVKEVDIVLATSPQFFCGVAGAIISRIKSKPFILEIRDIWPASIITVGAMKDNVAIRLLERIEAWMVRSAKRVVITSPGHLSHIKALGHKNIHIIPNGVMTTQIDVATPSKGVKGVIFAYFGTIGLAHNVEIIVQVAERLTHENNIKFIIAGDGSERGMITQRGKKLDNLTILPLLSRAEILKLLNKIDVGIVTLKNQALFKDVLPSKIFEYQAAAKSVILSIPAGEATGLIEKWGSGLIVPPEDVDALVKAIKYYANSRDVCKLHGENGRKMVENSFDRRVLAIKLLNLMAKVIEDR